MLDSIGSALSSASQMLSGGAATPNAPVQGTAKYFKGQELDPDASGLGDADGANVPNVRDGPEQIEFIHFGYVHTSRSNHFSHPKYKDNELIEALTEASRPRGVQFRAALEREAILLSAFMQATQTVLQERTDGKGAVGDVMNTLGSLTGAGGGGSGLTVPSDVNPPIQKVATAAGKINATPAEYKIIHQTGMDLHQARADYRALLKKITEEKPAADPAGGLMGKLPAVGGAGGAIGNIISLIQGIALKPLDIKTKFFAHLAFQQEVQVEVACHEMTLGALKKCSPPILPVWFAKDRAAWEAPDSPVKRTDDSSNLLGGVQNTAADAAAEARREAAKKANDVKDFFENPKTEAPGAPFLSLAFKTPVPRDKKSEPMPMEIGAVACKSFIDVLGLSSLPGFVESVIRTIIGINSDLLHGALEGVLNRDPSSPITGDALYGGARHRMLQRLMNLALDKVSFLKSAKEFQLNAPMGYSVKPGDLADKGLSKVDELVNDKIGGFLNLPLKYAMGNFADQLELARQQGLGEKCHTMELYLGRLPWMEATLFYNIFFPFWDALMDCVYHLLDGPLSGPLKAAIDGAKKAKELADKGRSALKKADAVADLAKRDRDALAKGVSAQQIASGASPIGAGYDKAMDSEADQINGPKLDPGKFIFPLKGRKPEVEGKEIKLDELNSVEPKNQWATAAHVDAAAEDKTKEPPPS